MKLGVIGGLGDDWREGVERIRIAEDLGYEYATAGEAWNSSILPFLTLAAANTEHIRLGTSILNCYSRTPAALAQEFVALDRISNGRMVLGLGSSGANVIEHFHGLPFEKPLLRMREAVEIFDTLVAGEKLDYDGEIFQLRRGFQMNEPHPSSKIPVWIAAISPKSIRQTGEIADGVIPIHWPKQKFGALRGDLEAAAREAGKRDKTFTIAPYTMVNVLNGHDDDAKWQAARQNIWFYVNRMGVFYWQMLERNGYEAEVTASRKAFAEQDKAASFAAISERMIRDLQCIGPIEEVREQLRERSAAGADLQLVYMPDGDRATVAKWLEALVS